MKDFDKENILNYFDIPILPDNPNYWLIRTESGSFYSTFKNENYVSIGFDKINIDDINTLEDKEVKKKILSAYPDYQKPGLILGQLKKFLFKIQKGDIIIIPSKKSKKLCIGQAISNPYQIKDETKNKELENDILTYKKRIDIKWIAEINRNAFDIYIYKLLTSHQGIVSANEYKNFINRMIFPIYFQNNNLHLSINVNKEKSISFTDNIDFLNSLSEIINIFNKLYDENINLDNISIKTTVNSPGVIELYGHYIPIIVISAFLFFIGGKFIHKSTKKTPDGSIIEKETNIETEGLLKKILDFIKHKDNTEIKKLKTLSDISFQKMEADLHDKNTLNVENKKFVKKEEDSNQINLFDTFD